MYGGPNHLDQSMAASYSVLKTGAPMIGGQRLPPTTLPTRIASTTAVAAARPIASATLYPSDDGFIEQLRSDNFDVRLSAIGRLLSLSRHDDAWFKRFTRKNDLFLVFDVILRDSRWEVQHQCIKFLADSMHQYGPDLEWCLTSILPALVLKLGSGKITIRRVTVQALTNFLRRKPEAAHMFQKALVNHALLAQTDQSAVCEVLRELPNLLISELVTKNWAVLVDGLTKLLLDANEETTNLVLTALEKVLGFVGQQEFNSLVQSMPEKQRTNYEVMLMRRGTANGHRPLSHPAIAARQQPPTTSGNNGGDASTIDKRFRFGVVPIFVFEQLNNDSEPKVRIHGLEELKAIVERLSEEERTRLVPHLHSYLGQRAGRFKFQSGGAGVGLAANHCR